MILFSVDVPISIDNLVREIRNSIKSQFIAHKKEYDYLISQYSEDEIYKAINSIYYSNKSIVAPTSGRYGQILRYLEYGGKETKQMKILSRVSNIFRRRVRDRHVI